MTMTTTVCQHTTEFWVLHHQRLSMILVDQCLQSMFERLSGTKSFHVQSSCAWKTQNTVNTKIHGVKRWDHGAKLSLTNFICGGKWQKSCSSRIDSAKIQQNKRHEE